MSNKRSSCNLTNQFNVYSLGTKLKATEYGVYKPLSQDNIEPKKDFSLLSLKALGGMPIVINPKSMSTTELLPRIMRGMANVSQLIVDTNLLSEINFTFQVSSKNVVNKPNPPSN